MNTELSYQAHKENWKKLVSEIDSRLYYKKGKDSIQYKHTVRPLHLLEPFLRTQSKWITIGDYNGLEANFLKGHQQKAFASDIEDTFLKEANKNGLIDEYGVINAEEISFPLLYSDLILIL